MSEPLKINENYTPQPEAVAVPAFRSAAVLDGLLNVPDTKAAVLGLFDLFVSRFGGNIGYMALDKAGASAAAKLVKCTPDKLVELRATLDGEMTKLLRLRLFGAKVAPMSAPNLPFLSILRSAGPATAVELSLPANLPDLMDVAGAIDGILRAAPLRSGFQSFGFLPDVGVAGPMHPAAFRRYRCAVMGEFPTSILHLSFRTANIAQRDGDYTPGITETGWRTYVGAAFRDRLGNADTLAARGVRVEPLAGMTVVTAGDAPIWGDVNKGDTIAGYQAAHDFLRPAYGERKWLVSFAPWSNRDPDSTDLSEGYVDRLVPEDAA